jgi:hypothetical protein
VRQRPLSSSGWIEGFGNKIAANWRGLGFMMTMLWKLELAKKQVKEGERFIEAFKGFFVGCKFFTTGNS